MKERSYLENSVLLCGESDGKKFKRTFTIVGKENNTGAFSICYEASYGSGRGTLKEFYPKDAYALERDTNGQLIHSSGFGDARERFEREKQKYIEPYIMLQKLKQKSEGEELAAFIPAFEIYYGCDDDCNIIGTVYIWTPEPKRKTFEEICKEIHEHPSELPERKMATVLKSIDSLTKCICILHGAGMLHMDIKPSNFGFVKRRDETLTQALSMFDINSVCSVFHLPDNAMGTEGYMEPEHGYERPTNQTDIYAIGATLFYAIVVSDKTKENGYVYQDKYYSQIRELVNNSKLIQASDANSHPRLRDILAVILEKCLCKRSSRYKNCEELIKDLKTALFYAIPSEFITENTLSETWVLAEAEKFLDKNKEKNATLALQYHLYKNPLYRWVPEDEKNINVLVIGFGNYGTRFLDICLQMGQFPGKVLNVKCVSKDIKDKETYLSQRPELSDFFNVDNAFSDSNDIYGNLDFKIETFIGDGKREDTAILSELIGKDGQYPNYIFIALGVDKMNFSIARACKNVIHEKNPDWKCSINYVSEKTLTSEQIAEKDLQTVCINENVKESVLYPEIERMAFNTHLVWKKDLNIDFKNAKEEFRETYNHDSCVSNVLSIKYKLYSIGIDLDQCSFEEAAKAFLESGLNTDKKSQEIKNELIYMEHRRWVTEKLCAGWKRIHNLEECMEGVTKDKRHKRHICILRSRPDQKLKMEYRDKKKWDMASDSDLYQLDELDRMSVELHRLFVKKAKFIRERNLLSISSMDGIRNLAEGNKKSIVTFQEWLSCLRDIWYGDTEKIKLYEWLKDLFLDSIKELPAENQNAIKDQVSAFETMFYPILASAEYRDYKQDDVALIENIPFILTYTESIYMAIPFTAGNNTELFRNVSAATVINPSYISYLCFFEKEQDIYEWKHAIPYMISYMKKKRFNADVGFIIVCSKKLSAFIDESCKNKILQLGDGKIKTLKFIYMEKAENFSTGLMTYLTQRMNGKKVFALEKNESKVSYILQGAGFYNKFPNFQFDSVNMKFHSLVNCDLFRYIKKKPYITVTDMAAFKLSSGESRRQPEFFGEYQELWKKYRENSSTWKLLCSVLKEHSKKNDVIALFKKKNPREKNDIKEYRYIIPVLCSKSTSKIVNFLVLNQIAEHGSRVSGYTTDSCEVIIIDRCGYRTEYDKLFANIYALIIPEAITFYLNTKSHEVCILFDNLIVSGVQIGGNKKDMLSDLMLFFMGKGYVMNLHITNDKMSFSYATRQIKELLTTAGKILEVYTYHKAKEIGEFNDVVSSFEIDWQNTDVKNEFDCILTKGFRTLFVECKARPEIEQDFYFKIACLTKQFGINATAVLIADTQEGKVYDKTIINAMQREHGNMMNVITVWEPAEIGNIGHILLKIINGTYVKKER